MRRILVFSGHTVRKFLLAGLFILLGGLLMLSADRSNSLDMQSVFSYGLADKTIVIDPGHGGIDGGAARGDLIEQDITLQIGKKLANYLSQGGAKVILLRENDSDLSGDEFTGKIREHKQEDMKNRVERANEARADLFISIHTNAAPETNWRGAQTFFKPGDDESELIATTVQEELARVLGNTKRSSTAGNFYVLKNVDMPAIMVETGFISNPQEGRLLADSAYQVRIVYAISAGIARSQISK